MMACVECGREANWHVSGELDNSWCGHCLLDHYELNDLCVELKKKLDKVLTLTNAALILHPHYMEWYLKKILACLRADTHRQTEVTSDANKLPQ